ncbi:MAG: NAD(P)-binding domain-containing protein, partial [Pirellula sp.]
MSESKSERVAFLGTGLMGVRMACNLIRSGFVVQCYNRTKSKADDVVAAGATFFETPMAAVADCD